MTEATQTRRGRGRPAASNPRIVMVRTSLTTGEYARVQAARGAVALPEYIRRCLMAAAAAEPAEADH